MLKSIFDNGVGVFIIYSNFLKEYFAQIDMFEFVDAISTIDSCMVEVEKDSQNISDNDYLNHIFVTKKYLSCLRNYSRYWKDVANQEFRQSWNTLQDIQDDLRVVKRFSADQNIPNLNFLEEQITSLEKLYPYEVFASSELIIGDVKCSICSKNMDSLDCEHIAGELYAGQMAYGEVGKIVTIRAIALVKYPLDKRCVVQLADVKEDFYLVNYLTEILTKKKISPWHIKHINETSKKRSIREFRNIKNDDSCPCGSGRKFKDCCINSDFIETPHIKIIITKEKSYIFGLP